MTHIALMSIKASRIPPSMRVKRRHGLGSIIFKRRLARPVMLPHDHPGTARRHQSRPPVAVAGQSRQDAYELLAPAYGWFTEGFDTADWQNAKAFLQELKG